MSEAAVPVPLPDGQRPRPGEGRRPRWQADLALVVAAFFFGTTFLVVQAAVERADPLPFLAVRFLIAGTILVVLGWRRPRSRREVRDGVVAGAALFTGYVLQTIGLQHTTASTSAFITYLLVVIVPLLSFVVLRRRPHPVTMLGVALAVGGLALLTGGAGTTGFGVGEWLSLGCAFGFAAHIVVLGETAGRHDPIRFTTAQILTVGFACLVPSLATGGLAIPAPAVAAAAFTGIFATALAFYAMVWAQRVVSPSRAALILLLEPVFAALLGWLTGDPVTAATVAGGGLILIAVVVSELGPTLVARYRGGEVAG